MATKFYSTETKKMYDTMKELDEAEKALAASKAKDEEKKKERAARAAEIDDAMAKLDAARTDVAKLIAAFIKDYGSYYKTATVSTRTDIDKLFDSLFNR